MLKILSEMNMTDGILSTMQTFAGGKRISAIEEQLAS
jgi:hypothetical protein